MKPSCSDFQNLNCYSALKNELVVLQDECDETAFKAHQLKGVIDRMRALDADFDQMISRLSSIHGIWNMVGVHLLLIPYLMI